MARSTRKSTVARERARGEKQAARLERKRLLQDRLTQLRRRGLWGEEKAEAASIEAELEQLQAGGQELRRAPEDFADVWNEPDLLDDRDRTLILQWIDQYGAERARKALDEVLARRGR